MVFWLEPHNFYNLMELTRNSESDLLIFRFKTSTLLHTMKGSRFDSNSWALQATYGECRVPIYKLEERMYWMGRSQNVYHVHSPPLEESSAYGYWRKRRHWTWHDHLPTSCPAPVMDQEWEFDPTTSIQWAGQTSPHPCSGWLLSFFWKFRFKT